MNVAIVTIGDEILIGQIIDTNSAWIANKMTLAGFNVLETMTIGDDAEQIKSTLDTLLEHVDIILTTGGLGPTKDDITKKTLSEYFDTSLVFDESVLENIKQVLSNTTTINELTYNQAYVPKDCTVIQNRVGTAPITWFKRGGKSIISMPGVPYEMQYVMANDVIPSLQKEYALEEYLKSIFVVTGYPESVLAMHLADFENDLPLDFGLAYLPSLGLIKLRLFVRGKKRLPELNEQSQKLRILLKDAIIAEEDTTIEKVLSEKLLKEGSTLSVAESCTGGNIAHLITTIAGSSKFFLGGVVSYSNEMKINTLQVSAETISQHNVVSKAVVLEMVNGISTITGSDCAISTSGIAGPDGGSDSIPVGTIWVATKYKEKCIAHKYQLGRYRESNISRASNFAMLQLLNMIK